jgi:hypothetical protein
MTNPARDYTDPAVTPKAPPLKKLSSEHEQATKPTEHYDQVHTQAQQLATRQAIAKVVESHPDIAGSR